MDDYIVLANFDEIAKVITKMNQPKLKVKRYTLGVFMYPQKVQELGNQS